MRYESQLLESSKTLIEEEKTVLMKKLVATKRRGVSNYSLKCNICYNNFGTETALVFSCHHGFHASCLDNGGGVMLSEVGEEVWRCVLCVGAGRRWVPGDVGVKARERVKLDDGVKCVDEKVTKAREFLKLYEKREDSSQIFDPDRNYIKSDKFHLRLRPAQQ